MEKTTIEGVEYYPADQVETLIRSRLAKVSERARTAESRLEEMEGQLGEAQSKIGVSDTLAQRVQQLEEQLSNAEGKYNRHTAISSHGFTDPDVRDLIEWAFDRAANATPEGQDRPELAAWLSQLKENPDQAPAAVRPHLTAKATTAEPPPAADTAPAPPAPKNTKAIPRSTAGLQPAPQGTVTIDQALTMAQRGDLSAYSQVREGLRARYAKSNAFGKK